MAEPKPGDPFGMDQAFIKSIDWQLAADRIIHDLRSDFIYAPHLAFIYRKASTELMGSIQSQLKAGTFYPGLPLTIETLAIL
jgi:hypothetical protein